MDELALAQIDADMAVGATQGVEEHQIAGPQIGFVDGGGGGGLLGRGAWQHQAHGLLVHAAHETAAVEAGFGRGAAAAIGHAQRAHGVADHVAGTVGGLVDAVAQPAGQALVFRQAVGVILSGRGMGVLRGRGQQDQRSNECLGHETGAKGRWRPGKRQFRTRQDEY
jgi:hypothetical protein